MYKQPCFALKNVDGRLLGLGIATVAVFAAEDYKGRMEFFETRAVEALT